MLLGFQFGIPIEEIVPTIVQMVGRKGAAVFLQVADRRAPRALARVHRAFVFELAALGEIARRAGCNDVVPGGAPAARTRDQMIEGEIVRRAAILAAEPIAQEHVEARKGRMPRRRHIMFQRDNARDFEAESRRVDRAVVDLDDIDPVHEDRFDRFLPRP